MELKTLINAASTIDFGSGSLTVIAFRLCDMETQLVNGGGHGTLENPDFMAMAEGNIGLIEEDGTLKYFDVNTQNFRRQKAFLPQPSGWIR